MLSVVGRNASGKSTLSKLMAGILKPERGLVSVDGLDTRDEADGFEIRRRVAFSQQNPESQFVSVTVEREIATGPQNLGFSPEDTRAVVGDMLEFFDLLEVRRASPAALSAGQMQKVLLAALLSMKPAYLILDEPTSYLDPLERQAVARELKRTCHATGTSIVWVTQFLGEALALPRILAMDAGRLCFDGTPRDFLNDSEALAALRIGESEKAAARLCQGAE